MEQLKYFESTAMDVHNRDLPKPNEDFIFTDISKGIFILLDGITRNHREYDERPHQSAACDVNEIFTKAVYQYLCDHIDEEDTQSILFQALVLGNDEIKKYREQKDITEWVFYPGTLGIISIIKDRKLFYACVGDCLGVILRNNTKIFFGNQPAISAVDMKNVSKAERYGIYCNHPEEHFSYTVFNGDDAVKEGIEVSFLDLHENDTVILVSDGMALCAKYERNDVLRNNSVEQLIEISKQYDTVPYAKYSDDKAIIKITIE